MEPPKYSWAVRYYLPDKPQIMYNFSGYKKSGKPSYTNKYENIKLFRFYRDAFDVAKKLIETGEYMAGVYRICAGKEDHFYFVKG